MTSDTRPGADAPRSAPAEQSTPLTIGFAGEEHEPDPATPFTIGRDGDLTIDDNPYLHRRLLSIEHRDGMWWVVNTGQSIAVSVATGDGTYQAVLSPGGRTPVVFPHLVLLFSAGPTTYELTIDTPAATFAQPAAATTTTNADASATIGALSFTPSQLLLLVVLCEPLLRDGIIAASRIPSSADAAARLGWPLTTFNRKLDNVCDKLDREGFTGLRGGVGNLARNRKSRLAEHAFLSRMVTAADLPLLDALDESRPDHTS